MSALLPLGLCLLSGQAALTIVLVVLLCPFGLSANPVLIALGGRFAAKVPPWSPRRRCRR
ncbi:hypothetical protein [Streptomyces sp. NPDC005485]|uniref:hypothetical protein n=1 Tax=Streptomyces sp. NPDC005485 TaxID=3155591 RepID=UPI0033BECD1C